MVLAIPSSGYSQGVFRSSPLALDDAVQDAVAQGQVADLHIAIGMGGDIEVQVSSRTQGVIGGKAGQGDDPAPPAPGRQDTPQDICGASGATERHQNIPR